MNLDTLIGILQELRSIHGDLPVCVRSAKYDEFENIEHVFVNNVKINLIEGEVFQNFVLDESGEKTLLIE